MSFNEKEYLKRNEFIRNFLEIKGHIKFSKHYKPDCSLCETYGHGEWNCPRYKTPQRIRDHLVKLGCCIACATPCHDDPGVCNYLSILTSNRGDNCRRCGQPEHVFWTCDGSRHPGSQFDRTKKVFKIESNDQCTQTTKVNHDCKKQDSLNTNDPKNFEEKDAMTSTLNDKISNKSISINTSTKSAPLISNDNITRLENKFESISDKNLGTVMLEIKSLHKTILENSDEYKSLKETVISKNSFKENLEKQNKEPVVDQKMRDYIENLETQLLEKEKLIISQNDEIQQFKTDKANMSDKFKHFSSDLTQQISNLESKIAGKDEILEKFRQRDKVYQEQVEYLICKTIQIFPELHEIDPSLDNVSFSKILDKNIQELNNNRVKFKEITKELSNEKEVVRNKDNDILELKRQIKKYEFDRNNNVKDLTNIRKSFIIRNDENEENVRSLNCHISRIQTDLQTGNSQIENFKTQVSTLESEIEQLKEINKVLNISKRELQDSISHSNEVLDFREDESCSVSEHISEKPLSLSKGADKFDNFENVYTTEVLSEIDDLDQMVTDPMGEIKTLRDVVSSLTDKEITSFSNEMLETRKNWYDTLKHVYFHT